MNKISWLLLLLAVVFSACSTTSGLPQEEVLYTGIKKVQIAHEDKSDHGLEAQTEMMAALDCAPNAAFLGSSTMRFPLPIGLWLYNALVNKQTGFNKWLFNTFATTPVLISSVNPSLRAKMASNALRNYGYFRSTVSSEVLPNEKNNKKAKVNYYVDMQDVFHLDSIAYVNFPDSLSDLIHQYESKTYLRKGDAFSVINLDAERIRLAELFQEDGFFFYKPDYMTFKADTIAHPLNVQLRMEPVAKSDIPNRALRRWYIGDIKVNLRRNNMRRLRDSINTDDFTVFYRGQKSPLRISPLYHAIRIRPNQLYSLEKSRETQERLSQLNIFSSMEMRFAPRDTTVNCNVLDVSIDGTLDRPISAELTLNVSKKNMFRGGEVFTVTTKGSYEWQTHHPVGESASKINSYELGLTAALDFPRLMFPGQVNSRSRHMRSTTFKLGVNELHRAGYFDILSFTGEATYNWQSTRTQRVSFSPIRLTYSKLLSTTAKFDSIMNAHNYLYLSMNDQFIPAMTISYTTDVRVLQRRTHTWWQTTFTESGNLIAGAYIMAGNKWNTKNKKLLRNPFAQFIKVTSELRKTFRIGEKKELATRIMGGAIWTYGNSNVAPYSEQFYVGGANSIRAYTVRGIGPGGYHGHSTNYMDQTGDIKFEANAEFRFNLVGSFNGAVFLDTGNVWTMKEDEERPGAKFNLRDCWNQIAVGTGLGLRYDMEFLVLRLDLGIALHSPYKTTKSGYYNIPVFKDAMSLHFAIGYPF